MPPQPSPILYDAYGGMVNPYRRVPITETIGSPGFAIYGGYVSTDEDHLDDGDRESLYRSYNKMLRDTAIVAAGVQFYLNIIAKEEWSFDPAEADTDGMYAELAEQILFQGDTSWAQVVRRASLYRFFGFSVQEWVARRSVAKNGIVKEKAIISLADLEPRPFRTVERWDTDPHGRVLGIIQRSPQSQLGIYLPINKVMYLVDRTLSDAPHGFGLMRSMVSPANQLMTYESLESIGFENDLRGIPVVRYPKGEIDSLIDTGQITKEQADAWRKPLESFIQKHGRSEKSGIMLDSGTYESQDEAGRPSQVRRWDVEVLRGGSTSLSENNAAITRKNREIARIMGAEGLLLGETGSGTYALSRDKTHIFFLLVDGALKYMRDAAERQLLKIFWQLNGFPEDTCPTIQTETVRYADIEEITASLRDMATAGATISLEDPVINDVRRMLGVSPQPEYEAEIAAMPSQSDDDDDMDDDMDDDDLDDLEEEQ